MKKNFIIFMFLIIFISPNISYSHDNVHVHPYIAEQAFNLWPGNNSSEASEEISSYIGTWPIYEECGDIDINCYSSHCSTAGDGSTITEGTSEEDDFDPIGRQCNINPNSKKPTEAYNHHFYDPDINSLNNGLCDYLGALAYAFTNTVNYWEIAKANYKVSLHAKKDGNSTLEKVEKGTAYWYLGRIAHLLGDASVPAHVHRDAHAAILLNPDSYETYMKSNYTNWTSQDAKNLQPINQSWTVTDLFMNLAQRAQYFPSNDKNGNTTNTGDWFNDWPETNSMREGNACNPIDSSDTCNVDSTHCSINDTNLFKIGSELMPLAIQYTARLYELFWDETRPIVRVMPDGIKTPTKHTAYAWAGKEITIWGNVKWGVSTSGTYNWSFGDGSLDASGTVSDPKDVSVTHIYPQAGTYYATLEVIDEYNMQSQATVRIDVLPVDDGKASINLAIERGLKRLYLDQNVDGSWAGEPALGALSVLSFENYGHLPIGPTTDIYHDTVVNGGNWLFTTLIAQPTFLPNWLPVESNDNGIMLGQYNPYCGDESFYPHGMIMMALAAAGPYDKNYPVTDAVHNPALNLTVPASVPTIGGWTYYKVLQDMMEFAAWAQADPGTWGQGGWRYCPNNGEADNSVGQWPVIGLEAAERWGIAAPPWVKDELKNYWLQNSYNSSNGGWGYTGTVYVDNAHSGAGLNMMAYVGIPKTDPWYVNALNSLATHWSNQTLWTWDGYYWDWWPSHFGTTDYGQVENYYAIYGIAKAMRIARDSSGNISEVTQIGTHNWYDEYSAFLKGIQQGDGSWPGFWYWGHPIGTAFAVLVLEPTVASLRPVAEISASPNPTPPNKNVTFNISGSTHQDHEKWLVSWKIDYDASNGVNWAAPDRSGNFPAVPIIKIGGYPETGSDYNVAVTLQVTDNIGDTAEAVVIVHVTSANVAPIAKPGGPYFGRVGTPITINGSASYDPNPGDTIISYEWDLDGDGQYNDATGKIISHTWNTPYSGSIGLKVCDNWGACSTGSAYTTITVADLKPVSYPLISYRRIDRYVWEYVYKFVIKNEGNGDTTNVSAQLQNWPNQVSLIDGNVSFGNVLAGQQVTSQDTFTIRINRQTALQKADLTWKLTYTDSAGTTWVIVNFPLYP
jgi:hypothetical protein